jgi:hypothetical protein
MYVQKGQTHVTQFYVCAVLSRVFPCAFYALIQAADGSKALVCGCLLADNVGSKPAGGMATCILQVLSVVR